MKKPKTDVKAPAGPQAIMGERASMPPIRITPVMENRDGARKEVKMGIKGAERRKRITVGQRGERAGGGW